MRLCAASFTDSQRNPRYCDTVVGRSILTMVCTQGLTPHQRAWRYHTPPAGVHSLPICRLVVRTGGPLCPWSGVGGPVLAEIRPKLTHGIQETVLNSYPPRSANRRAARDYTRSRRAPLLGPSGQANRAKSSAGVFVFVGARIVNSKQVAARDTNGNLPLDARRYLIKSLRIPRGPDPDLPARQLCAGRSSP